MSILHRISAFLFNKRKEKIDEDVYPPYLVVWSIPSRSVYGNPCKKRFYHREEAIAFAKALVQMIQIGSDAKIQCPLVFEHLYSTGIRLIYPYEYWPKPL